MFACRDANRPQRLQLSQNAQEIQEESFGRSACQLIERSHRHGGPAQGQRAQLGDGRLLEPHGHLSPKSRQCRRNGRCQALAQICHDLQQPADTRLSKHNVLNVVSVPFPHPDPRRHVVWQLPIHVQVGFGAVEVGSVERQSKQVGVGGKELVCALKRNNLIGRMRRGQKTPAQRFSACACAGTVDKTLHRRAARGRRCDDLKILERRAI